MTCTAVVVWRHALRQVSNMPVLASPKNIKLQVNDTKSTELTSVSNSVYFQPPIYELICSGSSLKPTDFPLFPSQKVPKVKYKSISV